MEQKRFSLASPFEEILNYSRVLVDGDWVFVSGCSGFSYSDMTISESMREQAEQTFRNIDWCLEQAEASQDDIKRIRVIIADKSSYKEAVEVTARKT